jgi:hypothetical protein
MLHLPTPVFCHFGFTKGSTSTGCDVHAYNPRTQEAEIRRIMVRSQLGLIVPETLSQKNLHKNRAGGVAQGKGPEFKPQYHKK